jgi:methionyl-tRNA formyltransferase
MLPEVSGSRTGAQLFGISLTPGARLPVPLKIAYFGLPLGALLLARDGHALEPCVLSPVDAPGHRRLRKQLGPSEILVARALDKTTLERKVAAALARARPDLLVSWFWTRLLPEAWLRMARLGGIGVHPSLLPSHRGRNPYFWTLDSGDEYAGATLHALDADYDTGDILLSESIPVGNRNAWQLARALDRPSLRLLREGARRFAHGQPPARSVQDETLATLAPEPSGPELRANFHWSSERVLRRIRALSPVPGLALEVRGLPFFVTEAELCAAPDALEVAEAGVFGESPALVIRTADGAIEVTRAIVGSDAEIAEGTELDRSALGHLIMTRSSPGRAELT